MNYNLDQKIINSRFLHQNVTLTCQHGHYWVKQQANWVDTLSSAQKWIVFDIPISGIQNERNVPVSFITGAGNWSMPKDGYKRWVTVTVIQGRMMLIIFGYLRYYSNIPDTTPISSESSYHPLLFFYGLLTSALQRLRTY